MRVLVTGATGFVGKHLVQALLDDKCEILAFDHSPGSDIRDYEAVRSAVSSCEPDLIFHLAAIAWPRESVTDPRRCLEVNVTGTLNVLEAVRHTGSHARILVTGTSEEYGYAGRAEDETLCEESPCWPATPYGVSKLAATTLAMTYADRHGMPVVAMRAFNHTGWGRQAVNAESAFARRIVAVERGDACEVVHGDLSAVRNFTDVRDMVAAYRQAIMLGPGIYNACSRQTVSMAEVMSLLVSMAMADVSLREDPSLGRAEQGPFPVPSAAKLRAACGWEPVIPLEATLAWLLDYWRSR